MSKIYNGYGPTAARKHGTPGKQARPKSMTIDLHSHIALPKAAAYAGPLQDMSLVPLAMYSSDETRAINAMQDRDRTSRMVQYDERLKDMDDAGVDMQLIMSPPGQCYYNTPIEVGVKVTQMVNEGIAEYVAGGKGRFLGLGTVPLQDGATAAEMLEGVMKMPGMKGVQILTSVNKKEISGPEYEAFWAKAEALGAIVLLHPNGFTHGERLKEHYFNNVIGNPLETTIAIHDLIFDGVLERYPNLKIIVVHGGGFAGAYHGRMDHAWGARSDSHAGLPNPPTSYLKKLFIDTVVFTNEQLRSLVEVYGQDKIVLGTDYPYDMADSDPIGHVVGAGFDATTIEKICGGNAKKLLGL
jgi:aminocarboxymuconate-semialdehyde decarboxylase